MKKWFLVSACFLAITCSQRNGLSEYDDLSNGLHVEVPNEDWLIRVTTSNCEKDKQCWFMFSAENGAAIYLAEVTQHTSQVGVVNLIGSINKMRNNLLTIAEKYPDFVAEVSEVFSSFSWHFTWIYWIGVDQDKVRGLFAAYLFLPTNPTKLYLFTVRSDLQYVEDVENDFVVFLESLEPAMVGF
jgi:hypothetical protein